MNNTSTTTIISQNNNSLKNSLNQTTAVSNSFKLQQNLKTITTNTNVSVDNVTPKWTTQQATSTTPKVVVASASPNTNFQMSNNANDSTMLITTTVNSKMTKKLHKLTNNPMMNASLDTSSLNKSINNNEFNFLEDDDLARRKFLIKNSQLIMNNIKNEINSNRSNYDETDLDEMNDDLDEEEDMYDMEDEDEFDDDEDDDDEEEEDDDDDDDDCSISASSTGGSPSHFLTSSPTSFSSMSSSSGCSTPTKSSKVFGKLGKSEVYVLNEKLGKKQTKKQKKLQMLLQQQQQLAAGGDPSQYTSTASITSGSGSKRNSRLQTMGYSSDNPAEKRAFHILSERQRRNDLKKLFETLRTSIPVLCDKAKASKLTILKAAVEHLVETTNKSEKQKAILDKEKQRQAQLMLNLKLLQQEHFGVNYHQQQQQQNHHQMLNPTNINTNNTNNLATLLVH